MDDRHIDSEVAGPLERSPGESPDQLRIARNAVRGTLVQKGYSRTLKHAPPGRTHQRRWHILSLPGSKQITLAEEFGAESPVDADASHK